MSHLSHGSSSGESASANALTITVIAGSVLLLLAALASPLPGALDTTPQTKQVAAHVAAKTTHPHRMS